MPGPDEDRVSAPMRALAVLAAIALAGCAASRPYPEFAAKNVRMRTVVESGSVFSSVRAEVHVHRLDDACRTEYLGQVSLDRPLVEIGLQKGHASLLVFEFESASFLAGTRSSVSREAVIRPLPGQRYEIAVSYRSDIYDVVVKQVDERSGLSREIALQREGC